MTEEEIEKRYKNTIGQELTKSLEKCNFAEDQIIRYNEVNLKKIKNLYKEFNLMQEN